MYQGSCAKLEKQQKRSMIYSDLPDFVGPICCRNILLFSNVEDEIVIILDDIDPVKFVLRGINEDSVAVIAAQLDLSWEWQG